MSVQEKFAPQDCLDILDGCLVYNIRRLSRLTTSGLNQTLAPTGLRCTQFAIMCAIGAHPNAPMTTLSEYLGMDSSTLTRSLENLEQQKFIKFSTGKAREKLTKLSKEGYEKLAEFYPLWKSEQDKLAEFFDRDLITRFRTYDQHLNELSSA